MKKRLLSGALALAMLLAILVGCESEGQLSDGNDTNTSEDTLGVALIVNGTIGDKSFNDLAYAGLQKAEEELGVRTILVENNYDTSKYESTLIEFSEDDEWDLLILNSYDVKELVEKIAPQYPNKNYVLYDADLDFTIEGLDNAYSMTYKQNEGSFVAGALATLMTASGEDKTNQENAIGFIAGSENTVINDFLVGYIEGTKYINPETKMFISYIGDWSNTAKGKEMALAQYMQGADIVFQVAAGAGLGVLDAAKETGNYAIGVDSDQYLQFIETDTEQANAIMTSMVKKVDETIYSCIDRANKGELPFGTHEEHGLEENAVGVAKNEYYDKVVPQEIKDEITAIEEKIISGEIVVDTAMDMPTDELEELRNSMG